MEALLLVWPHGVVVFVVVVVVALVEAHTYMWT